MLGSEKWGDQRLLPSPMPRGSCVHGEGTVDAVTPAHPGSHRCPTPRRCILGVPGFSGAGAGPVQNESWGDGAPKVARPPARGGEDKGQWLKPA